MRVSIASDHAGFDQKQQLVQYLHDEGYEVADLGPASDDRVDYPDFAEAVAREVADGTSQFGVLVCGTGIGMAIAANKIPGVRAANAVDPKFAELARQHNNANIITVSARFITPEENRRIVNAFLNADFEGGRHVDRVKKISNLEQRR